MKKARAFFQGLIGEDQEQDALDQHLQVSYISDAEYFNYRAVLQCLLERADQKLISFHPLNFNTLLMPLFSAFVRSEDETYQVVREFVDEHINRQCQKRIEQDQSLYDTSDITDEAYTHSAIGREQLIYTLALKALIESTGSQHLFKSLRLDQSNRMTDERVNDYLDQMMTSVFMSYQRNTSRKAAAGQAQSHSPHIS